MTRYDEFEISACIETGHITADGRREVEAIPCPEASDKPCFWSVYGHISGEGVECLCDCPTKEIAENVAEALREKYLKENIVNKTELWFEIGFCDENSETHTVYNSNLFSDCIREWKEKQYNKADYFIDVWEFEADGTPVPIANIDLNSI
jgi:hypothetical protein